LIIDCCHEEPNRSRGREFGRGGEINSSDLPKQTAVLTSCSIGEKSFEFAQLGNGVFTSALLKVLAEQKEQRSSSMGIIGD